MVLITSLLSSIVQKRPSRTIGLILEHYFALSNLLTDASERRTLFKRYVPVSPCLPANSRALSRRRRLSRGQSVACPSQAHLSRSSLINFMAASRSTDGFHDISSGPFFTGYCHILQFREIFRRVVVEIGRSGSFENKSF